MKLFLALALLLGSDMAVAQSYNPSRAEYVGPLAPGAATATKATHLGCTYTAAGITLTDSQQAGCTMNAEGAIRVDPNFSVPGGTLVPSITNKLRVRYSLTDANIGSAYSTIYTRTGTGLFFGFQMDFNSSKVRVKMTIDSGAIFEITVDDIKLFQFTDVGATRMQIGGFWTNVGNAIDFSSKYPIPYETITIEVQRTDAVDHTMLQYMIFLTEDS